jgi:hypothetical protein
VRSEAAEKKKTNPKTTDGAVVEESIWPYAIAEKLRTLRLGCRQREANSSSDGHYNRCVFDASQFVPSTNNLKECQTGVSHD